uniref:Uncharacterized protein n=1 Tax=Triticum urartu TaxID=4572 RepID=A0A8R7V0Q1_TRIUA
MARNSITTSIVYIFCLCKLEYNFLTLLCVYFVSRCCKLSFHGGFCELQML